MTDRDRQIGQNLQQLRGDMSQAALAEKMREYGFKWTQATVWSIEKGERPLRLTEAEAVADVFRTHVAYILTSPEGLQIAARMRAASDAWSALKKAASDYMDAQTDLMFLRQRVQNGEITALPGPLSDAGGWTDVSPLDAVREAIYEWEHSDDLATEASEYADREREREGEGAKGSGESHTE